MNTTRTIGLRTKLLTAFLLGSCITLTIAMIGILSSRTKRSEPPVVHGGLDSGQTDAGTGIVAET